MPDVKVCTGCHRKLPVTAYSPSGNGVRSRCRSCRRTAEAQPPPSKPPPLDAVAEHRLQTRVRDLESRCRTLVSDLSDARAHLDLVREVEAAERPSPIVCRDRSRLPRREATALACASDWHLEEEVDPAKVAGRNRYNLEIAEQRVRRFFESVRWATTYNRSAFTIRDLVLWLGGDLITGYLHPDNVETNQLSPVNAIAFALAHIEAGIRYLLEDPELERIVIPCNDGNHGRLTEKMRVAARTDNSIEWLLYTMLARTFANEPRVTFDVARGSHVYLDVYGRTIRFTHGDDTRYGGGVGGVTIPIYKALARWDTVRRADLTVMGHYHQLTSLRDLIINGSLIGHSPYALSIGARFEEPAQAFTIIDSLRGKSVSVPLWVASRDDDEVTS